MFFKKSIFIIELLLIIFSLYTIIVNIVNTKYYYDEYLTHLKIAENYDIDSNYEKIIDKTTLNDEFNIIPKLHKLNIKGFEDNIILNNNVKQALSNITNSFDYFKSKEFGLYLIKNKDDFVFVDYRTKNFIENLNDRYTSIPINNNSKINSTFYPILSEISGKYSDFSLNKSDFYNLEVLSQVEKNIKNVQYLKESEFQFEIDSLVYSVFIYSLNSDENIEYFTNFFQNTIAKINSILYISNIGYICYSNYNMFVFNLIFTIIQLIIFYIFIKSMYIYFIWFYLCVDI